MKQPGRTAIAFSAALAIIGLPRPAVPAQPQLSALQGAWLQQSTTCGEVYKASGKGLAFKNGLSAFVPAFIVSGSRLKTPVNSCRIGGIAPKGERWTMKLDCTGSVSTMAVSLQISVAADGTLLRYLNEQDTSGSRYQRCTAQDLQAQPKG